MEVRFFQNRFRQISEWRNREESRRERYVKENTEEGDMNKNGNERQLSENVIQIHSKNRLMALFAQKQVLGMVIS